MPARESGECHTIRLPFSELLFRILLQQGTSVFFLYLPYSHKNNIEYTRTYLKYKQ